MYTLKRQTQLVCFKCGNTVPYYKLKNCPYCQSKKIISNHLLFSLENLKQHKDKKNKKEKEYYNGIH